MSQNEDSLRAAFDATIGRLRDIIYRLELGKEQIETEPNTATWFFTQAMNELDDITSQYKGI